MVWIDEVTAASDTGGECRIKVKPDALYMSDGNLRPSSYIEFLAQSFGYTSAAHARANGSDATAPKKAFLVSVSRCETAPDAEGVSEIRVILTNVKPVGAIVLFDGEVLDQNSRVLCRASLKVYAE
jgi:predicted hotdog family 3-hydroxylacyl-ACP dehydratase